MRKNGAEVEGDLVGAPGLQNQCEARQSLRWVRFPCTSANDTVCLKTERFCIVSPPDCMRVSRLEQMDGLNQFTRVARTDLPVFSHCRSN